MRARAWPRPWTGATALTPTRGPGRGSRSARPSLPAAVLIGLVQVYRRYLSPLKGQPTCRFHPTCSAYAIQALETHGAAVGLWLAVRRVLKCHPLHPGGFDPVPPRRARPARSTPFARTTLEEE